jgi:hypothetical protein
MIMRSRIPLAVFSIFTALASSLSCHPLYAQAPPSITQSLSSLADQTPTHTGLVFDHNMLEVARDLLQSGGLTPDRASAALSSISFDNYRYPHPVLYAPDILASISATYHAAGWKHLVDAHDKTTVSATPRHGTSTDLWLHFNGTDIDGVTVLTRGIRNMNLIQIAGDLKPLELLRLSGHFGIPKVDPSAVMVPDPKDH